MRPLELDLLQPRRRPGWASYVLLAIALAFAIDVGVSYRSGLEDVARKESLLAMRETHAGESSRKTAATHPEELQFARDTVRRIAMPWAALFRALEAASSERIALLAIEPDAQNGTVSLTGEAKDYGAVLTYVAQLSDRESLRKVHLVRHEVRSNDPQKAISFSVSASWMEGR
jgi:hypothetical protein